MSTEAISPSYTAGVPLSRKFGGRSLADQPFGGLRTTAFHLKRAMCTAQDKVAGQSVTTLTVPVTDQGIGGPEMGVTDFGNATLQQPSPEHPAAHCGRDGGQTFRVEFPTRLH